MELCSIVMRLVALVLVLTGSVSAQQGSFTNYGRGCDFPSSAPPLIRATGVPQIGMPFTVRYIGANGITPVSDDHPILLTGLQMVDGGTAVIGI